MAVSLPTINLYVYDPSTPFIYSNLTLLASEDIIIPDGDLFVMDVPIETIVPENMSLVMEFTNPTGSNNTDFVRLAGQRIGNTRGSFIAAPNCNLAEPTLLTSLDPNFADVIFNVYTELVITNCSSLESGDRFPAGVTEQVYKLIDFAGNADTWYPSM